MVEVVDCHLHAHWPSRFAYRAPTGSRLGVDELERSAEGLDSALSAHGVNHALIIQPGAYGYDNSAMLQKIADSGGRYRGIASLPVETTSEEIFGLQQKGIVGVRLSLIHGDSGLFDAPGMKEFLKRCAQCQFFVEVFAPMANWPLLIPTLEDCGVPVIVEHLGWPIVADGVRQKGFRELLRYGRSTGAFIKLGPGFRVGVNGPPYQELKPFVAEILDAFGPDRCMWGSDWPFMNPENGTRKLSSPPVVAYASELEATRRLIADAKACDQVLCHTPMRLFRFDSM